MPKFISREGVGGHAGVSTPGHPEPGPECCRPGPPDPPSHLVELEALREKMRVGVGPAASSSSSGEDGTRRRRGFKFTAPGLS